MLPDDTSARPDPTSTTRRAVVVLGMHRSGTSAVAGCLARLEVDFGPRLMPPTEDNPRGYYEHIDLVNIHDRLLLALGRSWDDVHPLPTGKWHEDAAVMQYQTESLGVLRRDFPDAAVWGLKDPRLCHLLPYWEPLWRAMDTEPVFLLVHRSPREVANSLARREGFSYSKSYLLWLQHTIAAERHTRGWARALIDFNAFVMDWRGVLETANARLGHPWRMPSSIESLAVGQFVEPSLLRSSSLSGKLKQPPPWVEEVDAALRAGLSGREREMRDGADRVFDLLRAANPLYLPAVDQISADLRHELGATRQQARWYEVEWQKARARYESVQKRLIAQKQQKS